MTDTTPPEDRMQALARALEDHGEYLNRREGNVFCYSKEEYAFAIKDHFRKN